MTHVGTPPENEVTGNLIALNALAGIPLSSIKGFRAPFLNYSVDTLKMLAQLQFTYDSSSSASVPVTDPGTVSSGFLHLSLFPLVSTYPSRRLLLHLGTDPFPPSPLGRLLALHARQRHGERLSGRRRDVQRTAQAPRVLGDPHVRVLR
jgi:hypothetical protein